MKRIVSILILAYPILVFADKIYFKDDTSIEGEIIDYKGNYITFKVGNINDIHFGNRKYIIKEIDIQTFIFDMDYVYMATDSKGEIIAQRRGQDELIIGTNEEQYQYKAKADAIEDFDSGLKWLGISTAAFIGGLYVGEDNLLDKGWLMGGAVAFIAPIAAVYLTPVDMRLGNLSTKNEKHRNAYRTAYEKEIRKQRLKSALLGTGYSTVGCGVYIVLHLYALFSILGNIL
jgi:hypothetical protein